LAHLRKLSNQIKKEQEEKEKEEKASQEEESEERLPPEKITKCMRIRLFWFSRPPNQEFPELQPKSTSEIELKN
jgi:hypothetical protein